MQKIHKCNRLLEHPHDRQADIVFVDCLAAFGLHHFGNEIFLRTRNRLVRVGYGIQFIVQFRTYGAETAQDKDETGLNSPVGLNNVLGYAVGKQEVRADIRCKLV
jgi:hypothetical protein